MTGYDYDVVVVGSGFGGSVTALRATEKGYRVAVLEAGRRFDTNTLPRSSWQLRKFLWAPRLGLRGIQRITPLKDIAVLSGAGVGGGSLVYANTLYEPLAPFYTDPQWGHITDWRDELAPHYDQARRMLGVNEVPEDTPADAYIRRLADEMGVADTYHRTPVGVWFGEPGERVADPYFGGEGPDKVGCTHCGSCMVGCKVGAKNTLDRNYLYLAEKNGAVVHPDTQVTDLEPLTGGGWRISTDRPGAVVRHRPRTFTAERVVLSAGVLGTVKLLLRLRDEGRLPALSDRLGEVVRTNSEAIVGASARVAMPELTKGVAITSSIHPDAQTHIEPVRYPPRSNAMGLLTTVLVDGGGRVPRQARFAAKVVRHPVAFARSLSVRRWSERSIILLVMQSRNNSISLRRNQRLDLLMSGPGHGEPNPTYLPVANEAARRTAAMLDGDPWGAWNETILDAPTTAHILGGCVIGDSPDSGVIDPYQRVYGYEGLSIADGSAVSANLGVNPSLTITAMTERAMSLWPNKGADDQRPPVGEGYRRIPAVAPAAPAVPVGAPAELRPGT
ncbi:MAG: GMC family oxidoreductase [Microthrixaceae bacterium]|nr:GMC family oxidoreductase [Acidimicrobiales bacterium]MCB9404554.1 GMC family oxidoreductase [Microthrixaceae bacterium]